MTANRNIYQRMAAAARSVGMIVKQQPQGMRYFVTSHDAVTEACRDPLLDNDVFAVPQVVKLDVHPTFYVVHMETWFINMDDPTDYLVVKTVGAGKDMDKMGGGQSYAFKYALLKAMMLRTGTDSDFQQEMMEIEAADRHDDKQAKSELWHTVNERRVRFNERSTQSIGIAQIKELMHLRGYKPEWGENDLKTVSLFSAWFIAATDDEISEELGLKEEQTKTEAIQEELSSILLNNENLVARWKDTSIKTDAAIKILKSTGATVARRGKNQDPREHVEEQIRALNPDAAEKFALALDDHAPVTV